MVAEPGFDLLEFVKQNKLQVGLFTTGLFLLIVGITYILRDTTPESSLEIISVNEDTTNTQEIVVDVAGAVENPGVYRLSGDVRVETALSAAGGFSASADRIWVRRYMNLASKIPDGAKVYIPAEGESVSNGEVEGAVSSSSEKINVNVASVSQLDALWGIGKSRAEAIVAARPFTTIEEVKEKAGIPSNVFEKIKDEISVY